MLEKVAQQAGQNLLAGGMARHEARMASWFQPQAPVEQVYDKVATDKLIAELHEKAIRAQAEVKGQYAQVLALKEALQAVNSKHPLLLPSGEKFKDATSKSGLRKFYERAFDAFMKTCGGNFALNPQAYRKN
jgi:hypothetical protein